MQLKFTFFFPAISRSFFVCLFVLFCFFNRKPNDKMKKIKARADVERRISRFVLTGPVPFPHFSDDTRIMIGHETSLSFISPACETKS